jgi:hypothetical protein
MSYFLTRRLTKSEDNILELGSVLNSTNAIVSGINTINFVSALSLSAHKIPSLFGGLIFIFVVLFLVKR